MTEFCLQCGLERRPVRAVGWDEDGEPACTGHSVKSNRPLTLNQAPASEPAAAPSPVQTKAEEVMSEKNCKGFKRACGVELGELNRTGLCSACYARKGYHDRKAAKGATTTAVEAPKKACKVTREPNPPCAPEIFAEALGGGDPEITITLRQSQLIKLVAVLLQ